MATKFYANVLEPDFPIANPYGLMMVKDGRYYAWKGGDWREDDELKLYFIDPGDSNWQLIPAAAADKIVGKWAAKYKA